MGQFKGFVLEHDLALRLRFEAMIQKCTEVSLVRRALTEFLANEKKRRAEEMARKRELYDQGLLAE